MRVSAPGRVLRINRQTHTGEMEEGNNHSRNEMNAVMSYNKFPILLLMIRKMQKEK